MYYYNAPQVKVARLINCLKSFRKFQLIVKSEKVDFLEEDSKLLEDLCGGLIWGENLNFGFIVS